jgi:hypothetical protein
MENMGRWMETNCLTWLSQPPATIQHDYQATLDTARATDIFFTALPLKQ